MGTANTTSLFPSTITKLGSAIDLDSSEVRGVLGFANGGTNADSLSGAQSALGIGAIGTLGSPVPILSGGTGATSASAARVNLDLEIDVDVASYPALSSFSINGPAFFLNRSNHTGTQSISTITGVSDYTTLLTAVPIVSGGTGATSASAARVNLELEIDVDVQGYSIELSGIGELNTDGFVVRTGTGGYSARELIAGTGVVVTNGTGVSANPIIEIGQSVDESASPTFSGVYSTGLDKRSYVLLLSAATITYEHNVVYLDGTFDLQLPPIIDQGVVTLKNVGVGVVTVLPTGDDQIDGLSSISLSSQYDILRLHGNQSLSSWFIV